MTRILVFGGTFDPPHLGHVELVKKAMEHLQCEKVLFVIAATSPFKQTNAHTLSEHRLAMLKLALAEKPWAEICTLELDRGGTSYTIDTLQTLQKQHETDVSFMLLIGEDQAASFDKWHNNEEIESIASVVVLGRDGYESDRFKTLPIETIPVSSSQIRKRCRDNQSIEHLVSPAVCAYIAAHNLYM
ncbi:MAG: nicotinate (nicotinamide) nucleotide adenylyltransferase [Planctomycetes bacterium]|nr:nicotinate (nicotinamide) nucleotide adenylyltransferase [Planctomycetota bacterium]